MRRRAKSIFLLPALAAALVVGGHLAACSACGPAAPAWVTRADPGPVPPGWWTAVGEGTTRAEAEDAAMVRLAQRVAARVRTTERFRSDTAGDDLTRAARIDTDVRLLGAAVLGHFFDASGQEHAALVGFDPHRAALILAGRVEGAIAETPPRLSRFLPELIEQGATLAPGAADWADLARRVRAAVAAAPAPRFHAPPAVVGALREAFSLGAESAEWATTPEPSYRRGEFIAAWRLDAVVDGNARRWSGVARGGTRDEAERLAVSAAVAILRREGERAPW